MTASDPCLVLLLLRLTGNDRIGKLANVEIWKFHGSPHFHISTFPNFQMPRAYFDHNATTPPDPAVIAAMARALCEDLGNASSLHHFGQLAMELMYTSPSL